MIASLPMYDWPQVQAQTDAFYAALRARDLQDLLPPVLTRPTGLLTHWADPALMFSQTCWGPISLGLVDALLPLAQPDYGDVLGGDGPYYRSAIIARCGEPVTPPTGDGATLPASIATGRLAVNSDHSLSGLLAVARDLNRDPADMAAQALITGTHSASVEAVADGRADHAAIDCRSWALAQAHLPCAQGLVVIGWTSARLGLPYVTRRDLPRSQAMRLREALISTGCHRPTMGGME